MPYFYLPSRRIRKESISLLVCFVIAVGLNVYAIIHYGAPLSELWTSILYVLEATAVLYAVWILLRLLIYGFLDIRRRMGPLWGFTQFCNRRKSFFFKGRNYYGHFYRCLGGSLQ